MSQKQNNYDPDKLVLTKQEILDFCDRVLIRWGKKPMHNAKQILTMNTIRTSIYWTDEETLQQIWGEILRWAFELLYVNAIAQGKQEDAYWSQTMTKLIPRDQT